MTPAPRFAFGPRNYRLMWAGLIVLAVGFITMMLDKADYGEGFLGITLGPILLVIGFVIEFAAILVRSSPSDVVPITPLHPGVAAPVVSPTAAAPVLPTPAAPSKPAYKRL
jgi:hypothetical protein